ncbi:MAG: tetratricopeptide repeat protein [Candidatus Aminicenantes bacterium]|nr:tetratricopeptide repeat protein [Candidatus Aminicenantes bacterium]
MKKLTLLLLIFILAVLPAFSDKKEDRELVRTQDYIAAATKTGAAKIQALQAYIKKFPDIKQKWTKFAYYSLTEESFKTNKYGDAVKYGKNSLEIGVPGQGGEEARLYLILANSLGITGSPVFNKDEALKYVNKAVSFSTQKNLKDTLQAAKDLKKKLSGPPPKKLSPEQKIKMHYGNEEYAEAISFYKNLGEVEKADPEIHETYANALYKSKKYSAALKEFEALYADNKKAIYASRMADMYEKQKKRDPAVKYYLEASLLYQEEQNSTNRQVTFKRAQYNIHEKYDLNKRIEKYNKALQNQQSSAKKNVDQIAGMKRKIRREGRRLRKDYERQGMDPPQYELDKVQKLKDKLAKLESGGDSSGGVGDEGAKIEAEKKKIEAELKSLLNSAKKRLNL